MTTVAQLIEKLKTFDPNTPVYIGAWTDRSPMDGDGTDMSCYEPQKLELENVNMRKRTVGYMRRAGEAHVYISTDSYPDS